MPLKASLPPHCIPISNSLTGSFFPAALFQFLQLFVGHIEDGLHHGIVSGVILQSQDVFGGDVLRRQDTVIGQLFAAQTHDHDLAAEIGVADQVGDGPDGHFGLRRVDGHTAAVRVGDGDHTVHMGILGQQLLPDPLHGHLQDTGSALDGGHDAQQVAGSGGADLVAVAHPCGALRHRQRFHGFQVGAVGQVVQLGAFGQIEHELVDPASGRDLLFGVAQHDTVADDLAAFGDIGQRDLVRLRDRLPGFQAGQELRLGG